MLGSYAILFYCKKKSHNNINRTFTHVQLPLPRSFITFCFPKFYKFVFLYTARERHGILVGDGVCMCLIRRKEGNEENLTNNKDKNYFNLFLLGDEDDSVVRTYAFRMHAKAIITIK